MNNLARSEVRGTDRYAGRWKETASAELGKPRLRTSNPLMAGYLEGITQALYDIYFAAPGVTGIVALNLFQLPIGSNYAFNNVGAFAKTRNHTNLTLNGVLAAPNKHIIRAISVYVQGVQSSGVSTSPAAAPVAPQPELHPVDMLNFAATYCNLSINEKPYQDTIIGRLPAGGGVVLSGFSSGPTAGTQVLSSSSNNGWPDVRNTYSLAYGGIPLEQQQTFNFLIDPTKAAGGAWNTISATPAAGTQNIQGTGIGAWVFLDGTLFRAVQ